jgi:hypothetical protein
MSRTRETEGGAFHRERGRLALLAAAALAVTASPSAGACDYGASSLVVDATKTGAPPGPIGGVTLTVQRGHGNSGCGGSLTDSCANTGTITLHFAAASDPDNGVGEVGYRTTVVAGTPPPRLDGLVALQTGSFERQGDREAILWFRWEDGATNTQESIDFTVTLTPVDVHGNEGPTSAPIRIHDDGGGGGCAMRHGHESRGAVAALSALGLLLLAARRRLH